MLSEEEGYLKLIRGNVITRIGSPCWKDTELLFEKKELIPDLQRLLTEQVML